MFLPHVWPVCLAAVSRDRPPRGGHLQHAWSCGRDLTCSVFPLAGGRGKRGRGEGEERGGGERGRKEGEERGGGERERKEGEGRKG